MITFYSFMLENEQHIASFDFDDTIGLYKWDLEENDFARDENNELIQTPNERIINIIRDYKNKGYKVIVVTTRFDKWREDTVSDLKKWNVPIDEVYFTNGAWKANKLKNLGVEIHYDDDREELKRLRYKGIKGVLVADAVKSIKNTA